jgi:hypothetical protein
MSPLSRLFGRNKARKAKEARDAATEKPRHRLEDRPAFPLGRNIIADGDIRVFNDLERFYPLPAGLEYQEGEQGDPVIVRMADGARFSFLIEEEMLTFDEPYTRADGRRGYKTTEVIKRGA